MIHWAGASDLRDGALAPSPSFRPAGTVVALSSNFLSVRPSVRPSRQSSGAYWLDVEVRLKRF